MSVTRPAAVMILAAGEGTRMKSSTPKVLHRIGGRSLLHHAIAAAQGLQPERLVVVVRHARDQVAAHAVEAAPAALMADQDDVPGTGRAVWCGLSALDATAMAAAVAEGLDREDVISSQATGPILVTSADVPLVDTDLLSAMLADHTAGNRAVTVMTAKVDDPTGYGRIVHDADGAVARIVEHKDASDAELAITEINAGLYVFDAATLREVLGGLDRDNAQGELYLTDVVAIARAAGKPVGAFVAPQPGAVEGINDRVQLAAMGAALNQSVLERWMRSGVTIVDPSTTWIDVTVTLEQDSTILPGTQLHGTTSVATGAVVGPDSTLTDVTVGKDATVIRTHGSSSTIAEGATVGPFSYLRPGTALGTDGKIGAFVETKNATIGAHSKVPHLSYVGDATIGEHSNIGAATIFVNYDGVNKNHTTVGNHVRIGSDNSLIAPIT
ncbi:bifunctional UDP-N-acetylglucosamine diphosphorylase/glucosamine-1-phosphate N-acetyltransferase GlmU, partial [Demequina sp. TTPB684]|nr:bifunctional UDP-N-acetylglucosamine diphosphorylase/glucosamine-1-phosphate N-acetyltransferase GlmU [Demequina sp. TTPB684]